jgi:cell division septal protein FtsQ
MTVAGVLRRAWPAVVLAVVAVAWFGYQWGRDLSLFRVRHVEITGLEPGDSPAIRRALRETAMRMTVLHVDEDALRDAVDSFPVVRSLTASADFPNKLRIAVHEYAPVAVLQTPAGRRVAVAGNGTLLAGLASLRLPVVKVEDVPSGPALADRAPLRLVGVLAGAPAELRPLLARAYESKEGIRVAIRKGPTLYFGSPTRLAAKWAAATRVLADPESIGATFIDVRLPERPAAGGLGGPDAVSAAPAEPAVSAPAAAPPTGTTAPAAGATVPATTTPAQPTAAAPIGTTAPVATAPTTDAQP